MAKVQSKLVIFALQKYDGYIVVGEDNALPTIIIDEKSGIFTLDASKNVYSLITKSTAKWPNLIFNLSHTEEGFVDGQYVVTIVYSVYLEGLTGIRCDGYKWLKISDLNKDYKDYDLIMTCGKKRYV